MFAGKSILITGGTGSFGNAILGRLLDSDVAEIRVFSRDEKKQDDMRHIYRSDKLKFYIGDVRDYDSISMAMRGVDYVFSAAALKQVPSCEFYPLEAVKTNVLGTANTIEAAIQHGVKSVVVLSTDKAVYPINAMGMSKAIMEKVVVAKSRNVDPVATRLCATRYGNVIASRGSVIPLFIRQIKQNSHITITNPEMTRFMMTLAQAIDLVLFAFDNAAQGDIFVKKAPAATVGDLAAVLQEIFSGRNEVRVIGTRHGEKLYETLLAKEEAAKAVDLGDYFRVPADTRDLNYSLYFEEGDRRIDKIEEYNSHNTQRLGRRALKDLLLTVDYVQKALRNAESDGVP
jgi:UDP-N-acetylglucosamine 4,6-dehydratase